MTLTLCCLLGGGAAAQQVKWKSIDQAVKIDTKSNTKLYFVDFYTTWCGWCKKMDRETFTDPVVAAILNKYYVPVKFDAESNIEFVWKSNKYSNISTAQGGRASTHEFAKAMLGSKMGFPSFGIFARDQNRLTIIQGYQPAKDMTMMLWYFASGDNRRYTFDKYQQIFDKEIRPVMNQKLGL